jgi:hypothetical protein
MGHRDRQPQPCVDPSEPLLAQRLESATPLASGATASRQDVQHGSANRALREAQVSLLRRKRSAHPFLWSAGIRHPLSRAYDDDAIGVDPRQHERLIAAMERATIRLAEVRGRIRHCCGEI